MKLQKLTALTSAAVLLAGFAPANTTVQNLFSGAVLTAHAESTTAGSISLSEDGVLTLSGELTKDQIWAYRENESVTSIVAARGTVLPADCSYLFRNSGSKLKYDANGNVQYDEDGDEQYVSIKCWKNVTSVDLSNADTSKVTNARGMFCAVYDALDEENIKYSSYRSINLVGTDFSSVTNTYQMFHGCEHLTSIIVPNGIKELESWMFGCCSSLTDVTIPDSVTRIEGGAFNGCNNLINITIPDSLTDISGNSLTDTAWLKARQEENPLVIVNNSLIVGTTCSGKITIPNGVTGISDYAFHDCSNVTSITIPESVTSIGAYAFWACNSLTSLYFESKIPPEISIRPFFSTFVNIPDNMKIYVPAEAVETYKNDTNWRTEADRIIGYSNNQLANGEYKQTAQKNGTYYTRFVFVVPKTDFAGKNSAKFTATYHGTPYTFETNTYYTGVTSNGVIYTLESVDSAMFIVTVSSGSDISADLTCTLDFE